MKFSLALFKSQLILFIFIFKQPIENSFCAKLKFTYLGHKWSSVLGNVGSATTSVTICVSSLYHNTNIWMWECYDLFGKIRTLTDLNRQFMWPKASWCILGLNLSQLFFRAMYFGPIMRDQTHLLSNCTKQSMNNERTDHNTASCYLESFFLCIKKNLFDRLATLVLFVSKEYTSLFVFWLSLWDCQNITQLVKLFSNSTLQNI